MLLHEVDDLLIPDASFDGYLGHGLLITLSLRLLHLVLLVLLLLLLLLLSLWIDCRASNAAFDVILRELLLSDARDRQVKFGLLLNVCCLRDSGFRHYS